MVDSPSSAERLRGISPVVGAVLVVAIGILLAAILAVFVFDLGQSALDAETETVGTTMSYNSSHALIRVVRGDIDKLVIRVNGTTAGTLSNVTAGETIAVPAETGDSITIIRVENGHEQLVRRTTKPNVGGIRGGPPQTVSFGWMQEYDDTGQLDATNDLAVGPNGNVYVVGEVENSTDDTHVKKYSPSGTELWSTWYNGSGGMDLGKGVAVDSHGNVYVTGRSDDNLTLLKYNSSGGLVWDVTVDNGSHDSGYDVAVDANGNVYVTGSIGSLGSSDMYTAKYDSTGAFQWSAVESPNGTQSAWGIATDSTGGVYVTGALYSSDQMYTVKYDSTGNRQWARTYNNTSDDEAHDVATGPNGNVYITGYSDTGSKGDAYTTVKYTAAGAQQWVRMYNANDTDKAHGIAVDGAGNVYVTGKSMQNGDYDMYTIQYDSTGATQWTKSFNASGDANNALGIAVDSDAVYITGDVYRASVNWLTVKYKR